MRNATIVECVQRTPEWFRARLGRVNSSDASDMQAAIKSGEAAARRDLRMRLVVERLTGAIPDPGYISPEMARGQDCEGIARASYEAETGAMVTEIGYVQHDDLMAGYSPDGFVGADGLLEVKAPKTTTHLRYLRAGRVPAEYVGQLEHALFVTGRAWIDFVSFDDRLPDALAFFCVRLDRNDARMQTYADLLRAFLSEVDTELEALQTLGNLRRQFTLAVEASA